jgi:UDP-N-acetylmuramate--alanine ligase
VQRRFELKWKSTNGRTIVIEDYGHHPTEIVATLDSARQYYPDHKITVIFQPHRYSRTQHCRDGFLSAFSRADRLILTDIYAAGEDPIPGVSSKSLAEGIMQRKAVELEVEYIGAMDAAKQRVLDLIKSDQNLNQLFLCLGAGSITKLPQLISESIS